MTALAEAETCRFEHDAFLYDSDTAYTQALAPLLVAALDRGEAAISVVPDRCTGLLRSALDGRSDEVTWIAAEEWYRHPVRTIAAYDETLRHIGGRPAFVVGEVQFGASEDDWLAWTRYESALNRALERHRAWVICPYDRRSLPEPVVQHAVRTHPYVLQDGQRVASPDYVSPEELLGQTAGTAQLPEGPADLDLTVERSPRRARRALTKLAQAAGMGTARAEDLAVAVNEVVTNAVRHGGGRARLRVWTSSSAGELVIAVEDEGPGIEDPLLGYRPPQPGAEGGYGLWLAAQIFDRFAFGRSPSGGLTVLLTADA